MSYKNAVLGLALLGIMAAPARPIELSLEENRAERGNIGYVDMQKIFRTFPETIRAKANFEESIRQAEEDLNAKKTDLLRQRAALADMKAQRELLARTPWTFAPPAAPTPAPVATPQPPAPTPPAVAASTANSREALLSILPGFDTAKSTAAVAMSTASAVAVSTASLITPIGSPLTADAPFAAPPVAAHAAPAAPAPAPAVVSSSTPMAPSPAPASNPALAALDAQIEQKTRLLTLLESEFKGQQDSTEKNLLDLESRKTELLLGKINKAVQDVAQQEGISVVIDKNNILYGHNAVDLTDKVIKYLKGGS